MKKISLKNYFDESSKVIKDLINEKNEIEKIVQIIKNCIKNDNISTVAPFRVVNIGNSNPISLLDFIKELENILRIDAKKNFLSMQDGDVKHTHSDVDLLRALTDFEPKTNIQEGIYKFLEWYKSYY